MINLWQIFTSIFRVHPETKIYALRDEIEKQLGDQDIPREYVFVKSVGRSLTRVSINYCLNCKVFKYGGKI